MSESVSAVLPDLSMGEGAIVNANFVSTEVSKLCKVLCREPCVHRSDDAVLVSVFFFEVDEDAAKASVKTPANSRKRDAASDWL